MLKQMVGSVLLAKPKDMLAAAVVCEITLDAATVVSDDLGGINVRVALCDLTGCLGGAGGAYGTDRSYERRRASHKNGVRIRY